MCSFLKTSTSAALLALGMTVGAVTPILISTQASAQATAPTPAPAFPTPSAAATFPDVAPDYWARPFIQALAARNAIAGFPDGTFKPNEPVDRAEFAAMIQKLLTKTQFGS